MKKGLPEIAPVKLGKNNEGTVALTADATCLCCNKQFKAKYHLSLFFPYMDEVYGEQEGAICSQCIRTANWIIEMNTMTKEGK